MGEFTAESQSFPTRRDVRTFLGGEATFQFDEATATLALTSDIVDASEAGSHAIHKDALRCDDRSPL
jgi:hypothetical protein